MEVNKAKNLFSDQTLVVTTEGLCEITQSGRPTAIKIGEAAGARIQIGRSVRWNVDKVRRYLNEISE